MHSLCNAAIDLSSCSVANGSEASARLLGESRAYQALRERLRQLLSAMKISLSPRMDGEIHLPPYQLSSLPSPIPLYVTLLSPLTTAPLDESASTPNAAMGSLAVLIGALADRSDRDKDDPAGMLPPPSAAALAAPPVALDVVLTCGEELCNHLEAANNDVRLSVLFLFFSIICVVAVPCI